MERRNRCQRRHRSAGAQGVQGTRGAQGPKGESGASPNWVLNLIIGNAEQGLKEKFTAAMRSHVLSDPHVFCYRGQIDADKLNTATAVGMYRGAYPQHQGALLAFDAPGSVGYIQFLKEDWNSSTRWKYRNAVDNKLDGWNEWQTLATMADIAACNNAISAHINRRDNLHTADKATSVDGVKDYAGNRTIQIGWSGARVQAEECESLAVYKDSAHIKDMNRDEARKWLGIEALTVPVNPNHAPTAEGAIWIA